MQPLPLTDVATGACKSSATAASDGLGVDAAEPGVDADPLAAIAQMRERTAGTLLIERRRLGGWHRVIVIPHFGVEGIGDQDADRPWLTAQRRSEMPGRSPAGSRPDGGPR